MLPHQPGPPLTPSRVAVQTSRIHCPCQGLCWFRVTHHLMGLKEIADLLGVSRQRAGQLAATKGFPEPVARLAAGPIYRAPS